MNKQVASLKEAIQLCGLRDGMTIGFHHHLRNGDLVFNMVLDAIAELGLRDLKVVSSSIFDCQMSIVDFIQRGVITGLETNYMAGKIGKRLSEGLLGQPIIFRSHGHWDGVIESGEVPVDVAFLAAPCCDPMGNFTGKYGPSACGSLGYAFTLAARAKRVVAVTDYLVNYPLLDYSIPETNVDYVVKVDKIGEPAGIVSGITQATREPVGLKIGRTVCKAIENSGLFKDGFSFQTGAGSISLASAQFLRERMIARKIHGSFIMGGVTQFSVALLRSGCFDVLYDTQCLDLEAIKSLAEDRGHREISNAHYASPRSKSCVVQSLDAAVLGATEIDLDFNVNVHTDSSGCIMGGAGGHSDIAACNKLAIVVAPLWRARLPVIKDRVTCISTPGHTVNLFVSQLGIAVNPKNTELKERLIQAGMEVYNMEELKQMAEQLTGIPEPVRHTDRVVADVLYRDGTVLDHIYQ